MRFGTASARKISLVFFRILRHSSFKIIRRQSFEEILSWTILEEGRMEGRVRLDKNIFFLLFVSNYIPRMNE